MAQHLEQYDEVGKPAVGVAGRNAGVWARWVNVVLGLWLVVAAFLFAQSAAPRTNTWVAGLVVAAIAVWAMWSAEMRFLNTLVALWLLVSTLGSASLRSTTLFWNNLIVAVAILLVSLVPSRSRTGGRPRRYASP